MQSIAELKARDVMRTDVVTLDPGDTLEVALALFEDSRIGGAPVIDADRRLVGVLTLSDLARVQRQRAEGEDGTSPTFDMLEPADEERTDELDPDGLIALKEGYSPRVLGHELVGDQMSGEVVTVAPDASLAEVCDVMVERRIHRVFVSEERQLRGVISSFDVVRCVARERRVEQGS